MLEQGRAVDRRRLARWWLEWGALAQAAAFLAGFSTLMVLKHNAFHTFALDLAKFDQAIWNTLRGRFLYSTLQDRSILANHFSPFLALLSPLFLFWSDVRALMIVQTAGLAAAGLFLYGLVRSRNRAIAPWVSLAFYLNPALHEVALTEVRRVTFAVPFLALALFGLAERKRGLMCLGLAMALLCKENVAVVVAMVGVYVLIVQRDWKWGVPVASVGVLWAVGVTFWVIAAMRGQSGDLSVYPQLNYFGLSGDSYSEIVSQLIRDPLFPFRSMFDAAGVRALWRVFLPVGVALPLLAPDWLLIVLPSMAYMLMSTARGMHRLEDWYMASLLPGLFAAVGVGLTRLSRGRLVLGGLAVLLGTTVVGYALFSHGPLGGLYDPALYRVGAHERMARAAVKTVPDGARVAAQDPYVPHLSHRRHIYLYPWVSIGMENIDYLVLDRHANPYPLQPSEMNETIDNLVADTSLAVEFEADGIFVLRRGRSTAPAFDIGRVADGAIKLARVEVAVEREDGSFETAAQEPVSVKAGQVVRVSVYWEAVQDPTVERTVSVRISPAGSDPLILLPPISLHDGQPGAGRKPTSWWKEGWQVRDVHYLDIPADAAPGSARVSVLLYDSLTGDRVPFEGSDDMLSVCRVTIEAPDGE